MMEYVGLRWFKCDFHIHTMKSLCYKEKTDTPKIWVDEIKKKGLQCIAITDHNDYRGIDEIKTLCEEQGITVFPGVEVSCDGSKIHMLILFDINESGTKVQEFLNTVEIYSADLGNSAVTAKGDIFELCLSAKKLGGVVIAAHIDEYNGINAISHHNIETLLDRKYLDAVQVVNADIWEKYNVKNDMPEIKKCINDRYGKNDSKDFISEDVIKHWHQAYQLAKKSGIAMVTFSDNPCAEREAQHGLWGIGKTYTWIKMNPKPNLESVRQALISADMRVRNCFETTERPDSEPELWIKSIIACNTNLNKSEDIVLDFNPQMNTIIGGRGSGKSAVVRMLAGGLLSFDDTAPDSIKKEQNEFYQKIKKDKKGIFNDESSIEIQMLRNGDLYKIIVEAIESMDKQKRTLYRYQDNEWVEVVDHNYFDFFKAQVYTQKQIYEVATDVSSLLSIIDDGIPGVEQKKTEKENLLDKIVAKMLEIKTIQTEIEQESKIQTELHDINEQIGKYEESGISEMLKELQRYETQQNLLDRYLADRQSEIEQLSKTINDIRIEHHLDDKIDDSGLSELIKNVEVSFLKYRQKLEETLSEMVAEMGNYKNNVLNSGWKQRKDACEQRYRDTCDLLKDSGVDIGKLDELIEKRKEKIEHIEEIQKRKIQIEAMQREKEQLYHEYDQHANVITQARKDFIVSIIGKDSNVKFDIKRRRSETSFVCMMKDTIQKDNETISKNISELADLFFRKDGIDTFRNQMEQIRLGQDSSSYSTHLRKAIMGLTSDAFARMISFIPEDDLVVSYKPEKSKNYIPLSNASAGQKTTAILTFLLAYGTMPLLLDQPEDDLDNKLVYDLIVSRLKECKGKRQIIVVTHNANIPVNGDAEYIISMNSETDVIRKKYMGTMDDKEIREEICDVMEGTQPAFEMRAKKYHFKIQE